MVSSRPAEGRRKVVVYVGGFGLPDRTASAQRCLGNARLMRSIGYDVVVVGKLAAAMPQRAEETRCILDGFRCYDIRRSDLTRPYASYVRSAEPVAAVLQAEGTDNIAAVIAYNYPAPGLAALLRHCRPLGIPVVAECTEWHGWEGGRNPFRNIRRLLWLQQRHRVLAPQARNIVCASHWLAARYGDANVIVLPWVIDANQEKWHGDVVPVGPARRFVYAGSPGAGLEKDRLHFALAGFAKVAADGGTFEFRIAGLTRQQYLSIRSRDRSLLDRLGERVQFLGRVPHAQALQEQRSADFAVFFRADNRQSRVGFPTKFVEARTLGVPVVTNRTSDIGRYLTDGEEGFLAETVDLEAVTEVLARAVSLPAQELAEMKARVRATNPFHYVHWQSHMTQFMDGLKLQA